MELPERLAVLQKEHAQAVQEVSAWTTRRDQISGAIAILTELIAQPKTPPDREKATHDGTP